MATFVLSRARLLDARAVWLRNYSVTLKLWRTEVIPPLAEPAISIFAFGWGIGSLIASNVMGIPYLTFVGAGILVFTGLLRALFETTYGSYFRMVYQSTYDAILCTPVNVESLALAEIGWGATKAAFDSLIILFVLLVFGVLRSPWSLLIPLVVIAAAAGLAALSLAYTASIPSINHFNYYLAFIFSTLWISGAYFPVQELPRALQYLAWVFPITSVVDVCRGLMVGRFDWTTLLKSLWIALSSLILVEIALRRLAKRMLR
jgi:lipooligosaccharide transport system permease protein